MLIKMRFSLSFLPFSHIFERAWVAYVLHRGAILCYLEDTNQVRETLTEVRPTFMCAVPRFYEKIYSAVLDKVQKAPFIRQMIFHWAIAVGQNVLIFSLKIKKSRSSCKNAMRLLINWYCLNCVHC